VVAWLRTCPLYSGSVALQKVGVDSLEDLRFDNRFVRELPGDAVGENYCRPVLEACYSRVSPTPVADPSLVACSAEVVEALGLALGQGARSEFAEVFAGNRQLAGMRPYAACYGGHQFGNWAGQLGDGRAIALGEVLTPGGGRLELQLKGAGPTPYSRGADGRAVMRSSVREFLCSEAMHHLGVPTTRALSLVATGESVVRDMFYDGNPRPELGAVVCRVAPSFLRFGNYQIFAARRDYRTLRKLLDFTLRHYYPELGPVGEAGSYLRFFEEVGRRTLATVLEWQRVGFVHGVMNTDNMSILGLTIDYGPYGWLDDFDPDWTPNTTDAHGRRYRYGHQPQVALWNLARLAEALAPLMGDGRELGGLEHQLADLELTLKYGEPRVFFRKLGLHVGRDGREREPEAEDLRLVAALRSLLVEVETDMTLFFRGLANVCALGAEEALADDEAWLVPVAEAHYRPEALDASYRARLAAWMDSYRRRLGALGAADALRRQHMNRINPKYVLRNYLAQLAIDRAEAGDASLIEELLQLLRSPYDEQPEHQKHAVRRPDWARDRPGCSMLSCSS